MSIVIRLNINVPSLLAYICTVIGTATMLIDGGAVAIIVGLLWKTLNFNALPSAYRLCPAKIETPILIYNSIWNFVI